MESPRQEKALKSLDFEELFGEDISYDELQAAEQVVRKFVKDAETIGDENDVKSFTIPSIAPEQKEALEQAFAALGIYGWNEENIDGLTSFIVENPKELQKLKYLRLIDSNEPEISTPTNKDAETEGYDEYSFPLPNVPKQEPVKKYPAKKITLDETPNEVEEVDEYMKIADQRFSQGQNIEPEPQSKPESKYFPNLKQFKQEYFFQNGNIFDAEGNEIPFEEYKEILLAAKDDPEKMRQAVKMSTGLVKMTLDRILNKFRPNQVVNADDLLQAGMEGLVEALNRLEDRGYKPSSYLVPYIEGHIRSQLRTQKEGYLRKSGNADQIAKYLKTQNILEREDPEFGELTSAEKEQKIAEETGTPLELVRKISNEISGKFEEYDDESVEHNEAPIDDIPFIDPESDEYQRLREAISENLESMTPREELAVRLYYGITSAGRWRSSEVYDEILNSEKESSIKDGTFSKLIAFDPEIDSTEGLEPAEKMFLAITGKISEEAVTDLHNNNLERPTEVTLEQIGHIFGTRRERPRQMIAKGLRLLKHPSRTSKMVKTGYVKKQREIRQGWRGETIESTRYRLDGDQDN